MEWKDVAGTVGKVAPMLGTLIGGPAGAVVGGLVASALGVGSTPDEVSQALATNPEAAVKLKQIEADRQVRLQELLVQAASAEITAASAAIQSVNTTMQAEAKADHWPTYSWRPAIGFVFAAYVASLFVLPLFDKTPVALSPDMTLAIGGILGVASWFRGRMQADPRVPADNRG
ncbi:MAG TPA: 3TM-type holin [Aquabacterium sp.]|nr:3TM-type holin [Aquabacterium sp.]